MDLFDCNGEGHNRILKMVSQPLYLQVRCKKNYEYSGWLLVFPDIIH